MKKTLLFLTALSLVSCVEETPTTRVDKKGSVVVSYDVVHSSDNVDILRTNVDVYNNTVLVKSYHLSDTIPTLAPVKSIAENEETGETKEVMVPRDYQFYVTIKNNR
jgi:hypothetical protein